MFLQVTIKSQIGKGEFGEVQRGILRRPAGYCHVAVKTLNAVSHLTYSHISDHIAGA